MASRILIEGVLGGLSGVAWVFTFTLGEGRSFVGEPGLGVETLGLSETVEPVFRTMGVLDLEGPVTGVEAPTRAAVD